MPQQNNQNGTKTQNGAQPQDAPEGITRITVGGFKSIAQEQSIEIRPLTILAGANSSGKSSIMQPLLLMKQTLEAPYDPGPLRLDGPIIKFTSVKQLLSSGPAASEEWFVRLEVGRGLPLAVYFEPSSKGFTIKRTALGHASELSLSPDMTREHILRVLQLDYADLLGNIGNSINEYALSQGLQRQLLPSTNDINVEMRLSNNRCFLELLTAVRRIKSKAVLAETSQSFNELVPLSVLRTIYLQGLRGSPTRTYPVTSIGDRFPGSFENYTASVLSSWQAEEEVTIVNQLEHNLASLGLTNTVSARMQNDVEVELYVGRTLASGKEDMVNIADVGIGVSQILPVLVALLAAEPGQLVYLEQPEIHLHPRAQTAMAQVLADAAMRGVRVVAETHSSLLLLGVQTLVAEGKLPPELVKLHWFTRGDDGATTIRSADLDEGGAFGDWPEDFDDETLKAQSRYLDAADAHLMRK